MTGSRARRGGPERVLDLIAERAPNGFDRLEDVITSAELADIVGGSCESEAPVEPTECAASRTGAVVDVIVVGQ